MKMNKILIMSVIIAVVSAFSCLQAERIMDRSEFDGSTLKSGGGVPAGFYFRTGSTAPDVAMLGFIDLNNSDPLGSSTSDGLQGPVTVTLWLESTGAKVAEVVVQTTGVLADGFRYAEIPGGPITLAADTDYVVSAYMPDVSDPYLNIPGQVTFNSYFVGGNSSDTWGGVWGSTDPNAMPTNKRTWTEGAPYGICNMSSEILDVTTNINDSPDDKLLENEGDPVTLSVGVESLNPVSYQWKYSSDRNYDAADANVGTDSNSFTDSSFTAGDVGYYYCVVTADGDPNEYASGMALVDFKRLMGHWKLDNDLTDASGNGWAGNASNALFDSGGIDGACYDFSAEDPSYTVRVPNSEEAFNNFKLGLTVSAWVKMPEAGTSWSAIVSKNLRIGGSWTNGWMIGISGGGEIPGEYPYFSVRGHSDIRSQRDSDNPISLVDNQWHLLTGTYDPNTGEAKLYIDAELNVETASSASPVLSDAEVRIGDQQAEHQQGEPQWPFKGLVDDVKIYNYAITEYEVVDMYNDFVDPDKSACLDPYYSEVDISGPDGEPDCVIDEYDLAVLLQQWMDCTSYPDCVSN